MESWLFIIFISLCLCTLIITLTTIQTLLLLLHLPPGPLSIPIITNLLLLTKISPLGLHQLLRSLHAKYGSIITIHRFSTPYIFIADRSLAHKALIQNGATFADRPKTFDKIATTTTQQVNITSALYGPTWRFLRRNLTSKILNPSRIRSFSGTRKRVLDDLLNRLKSDHEESTHSVTVVDHFQHAMFCLLVFVCFGERVSEQHINDIEDIQRRLLLSGTIFNGLSFFLPMEMITRILFRKRWDEMLHLRQNQKDLLTQLVRARKDKDEGTVCYVDTLLDLELPDQKRKLDEGEVVSLCSEFLTGGTDTTSTALQWIMANLVKYQHVQKRLVMEIRDVIGDREENEVKEEDLIKLPYLKAVVLEGLRRHPPAYYTIPHAVTNDVVLNGYLVPRNGTVNFMVAEMGWDPKVWEDPMTFKPDRFLSSDKSSGVEEAFDITGSKEIKMMPFGAGRRICPAYNLAILHLEYYVANLTWNFEWKASNGSDVDLSGKQEFTVVMKHALQAQISPRT